MFPMLKDHTETKKKKLFLPFFTKENIIKEEAKRS